MSENSSRSSNNSLQKAMESIGGMEKHCEEMLRRHQKENRNALEVSQDRTAELLSQTYDKYNSFSLELQNKIQMIMDKLQKITSTSNEPDIQAISKELQSTLDSVKTKYRETNASQVAEAKELRDKEKSDAVDLNFLQESDAEKRSVLQKVDADQLKIIQESFADGLEKLLKNKTNTLKEND